MPAYQHPALVVAEGWHDYELLETGDGLKKERWGRYVLVRPDPQVVWGRTVEGPWTGYDAFYQRSGAGGGAWAFDRVLPESWTVGWGDLTFKIRPTGFKHTGLFPEQAANWAWMTERLGAFDRAPGAEPPRVLNLFGYTGAATVACAAAGAAVTHVDAAKGMVAWCRENAALSGFEAAPIRYLVDDCAKFVDRELRRGARYDAVVLDPPVFGRGGGKETWRIEDDLWPLLQKLRELLAERPAFFLLNTYTAGLSPVVVGTLLQDALGGLGGAITVGEIGLPVPSEDRVLPCGVFGRWAP